MSPVHPEFIFNYMQQLAINLVPVMGVLGLVSAYLVYLSIKRHPAGEGIVATLGDKIHRGAMVFMRLELIMIAIFSLILGGAVTYFNGWEQGTAFFAGVFASAFAGFIGMFTATKANVRTAVAARDLGAAPALGIAFFGGSVMGLTVASMGLIGLGTLFAIFSDSARPAHTLEGFAMGASLVALFYRVGGGIFTKAADVGADLVGKIEAGIPEDDPRNPGVIADNVGDNVGDVAGMGSDIFESYCGTQIATVAIAGSLGAAAVAGFGPDAKTLMFFPFALTSIGLVCSLLGILLVRMNARRDPANALRLGTIGSAVLYIFGALGVIHLMGINMSLWSCVLAGAVGGIIIGLITEYYTGGKPVRDIARAGETGVATLMIRGLAVGLESAVVPLLTIAGIVFTANHYAGLYGVGVAAVSMLATVGITMAIDAYGPVADNAGGIAEMSKMGEETRKITDSLDAVGNTTAAIGKGFAIGAAGLSALTLTVAFKQQVDITIYLDDPRVLIGVLIGGSIPFLNGAITMNAVGRAAYDMINEIRRQFRENPGILTGEMEPDSDRCVDIATKGATKRMLLPALLAVGAPVLVGFLLGPESLAGMLVGALVACVALALMMANAGGAWDNAKKYVEEGHFGGKGSETHKSAVVGDTVGDPFKDTSGPSMNILINVMAIVSLVIAPLLKDYFGL